MNSVACLRGTLEFSYVCPKFLPSFLQLALKKIIADAGYVIVMHFVNVS